MRVQVLGFLLASLFSLSCFAGYSAPPWFERDLSRGAPWIPRAIAQKGWQQAGLDHYLALPSDVQAVLYKMGAPLWMMALMPTDASSQNEIIQQLRLVGELRGAAPVGTLAERSEKLLLIAGILRLPTPGDKNTGRSLGAEGCTAALMRYVLSEIKLEFPDRMAWLPESIETSQSSSEFGAFVKRVAQMPNGPLEVFNLPYESLSIASVRPGDLMIGQKPGGAHMLAWARVPSGWNWSSDSILAIANTGLAQFGERMILAQEYLTGSPTEPMHNDHGPLNSGQVVRNGGRVDLSDPRTNVYAAKNASFLVIRLRP